MVQEKNQMFYDEFEFLSNFYHSPIHLFMFNQHFYFNNVECPYQALKENNPFTLYEFQGLTPNQAKCKGRRLHIRKDWEDVKEEIMLSLVWEKFHQNKDLADKLMEIEGDIVEYNCWRDEIWGIDINTGKGENLLGKILMKVRDGLTNER